VAFFVAGRAAVSARGIDEGLPKIRRFALATGLLLLMYVLAEVQLTSTVKVSLLGVELTVGRPRFLVLGFLVVCLYAAARFWYYGIVMSISPGRARRDLLVRHQLPGGNPPPQGPVSDSYLSTLRSQAEQEVRLYFPSVRGRRLVTAQVEQSGETARINVTTPPCSTRLLCWWQNVDYTAPLWLNVVAILCYCVGLVWPLSFAHRAWPGVVAAPQAAGEPPMITDWIIAGLTFIIAIFTFLVWRVYRRIAWLTGSMETHSDLMLRLQALIGGADGKPIELIWWDPTIEDAPGVREHGKPVEMKRIHIYLPLELRRNKPPLWKRLWTGQT